MYMAYIEAKESIERNQLLLKNINKKIDILCRGPKDVKSVNYDKSDAPNFVKLTDNELYQELNTLVDKKNRLIALINADEASIKNLDKVLEKTLKKNNNIEYEVFRYYIIQNIPLWRVSEILGYSYGYIRNIATKVNKKLNECKSNLK